MGKKPIVSITYENERISIKKQLTLLKMCVKSLLCGPRADLWSFYGFLCKRFSLYIKVNLFECYATMPMLADAHISSLGELCKNITGQNHASITAYRIYKRYYTSIVDAQLKWQQENCEFLRDIQFRP